MSNSSKHNLTYRKTPKTGATYTLIEFSAEYIALSLLLQDDVHTVKSAVTLLVRRRMQFRLLGRLLHPYRIKSHARHK